jgi:hypothetical protein
LPVACSGAVAAATRSGGPVKAPEHSPGLEFAAPRPNSVRGAVELDEPEQAGGRAHKRRVARVEAQCSAAVPEQLAALTAGCSTSCAPPGARQDRPGPAISAARG